MSPGRRALVHAMDLIARDVENDMGVANDHGGVAMTEKTPELDRVCAARR